MNVFDIFRPAAPVEVPTPSRFPVATADPDPGRPWRGHCPWPVDAPGRESGPVQSHSGESSSRSALWGQLPAPRRLSLPERRQFPTPAWQTSDHVADSSQTWMTALVWRGRPTNLASPSSERVSLFRLGLFLLRPCRPFCWRMVPANPSAPHMARRRFHKVRTKKKAASRCNRSINTASVSVRLSMLAGSEDPF